jgi:hypothetical protein
MCHEFWHKSDENVLLKKAGQRRKKQEKRRKVEVKTGIRRKMLQKNFF